MPTVPSPNVALPAISPPHPIELSNGLTVIHQYLPTTTAVAVDVWVKAGTRTEPEQWYGMAHFLEHMVFKGSARIQPGEFDGLIESCGGITNAATSHDYAHFFLTIAPEYLSTVLPVFADILLNAAIPEEEFEREREVVLEEIRGCHDDPDWHGFRALSETVYGKTTYGRSILGTESQVRQRSVTEMRRFHRTHYQPENMTVAIVGAMPEAQAIALVSEAFCQFPSRADCPTRSTQSSPVLNTVERATLHLPRLEESRLALAWPTPGVQELESAIALDILAIALGGGRTSRLVRDLREEKQWVWDIDCEFSLQQASGLFTINAWLDADTLEPVEAKVVEHLQQIHDCGIQAKELARIKRLLINEYVFGTETPAQLASLYGYYHTIAAVTIAADYPQQIQAATCEQVQAIAQKLIPCDRYAVTTLVPA